MPGLEVPDYQGQQLYQLTFRGIGFWLECKLLKEPSEPFVFLLPVYHGRLCFSEQRPIISCGAHFFQPSFAYSACEKTPFMKINANLYSIFVTNLYSLPLMLKTV